MQQCWPDPETLREVLVKNSAGVRPPFNTKLTWANASSDSDSRKLLEKERQAEPVLRTKPESPMCLKLKRQE